MNVYSCIRRSTSRGGTYRGNVQGRRWWYEGCSGQGSYISPVLVAVNTGLQRLGQTAEFRKRASYKTTIPKQDGREYETCSARTGYLIMSRCVCCVASFLGLKQFDSPCVLVRPSGCLGSQPIMVETRQEMKGLKKYVKSGYVSYLTFFANGCSCSSSFMRFPPLMISPLAVYVVGPFSLNRPLLRPAPMSSGDEPLVTPPAPVYVG